jgi:hypothetical protein
MATQAPNSLIGNVEVEYYLCKPQILIKDGAGNVTYTVVGACCGGCFSVAMPILKDGVEVGSICKKWSGLGKELFTDADNFTIEFPPFASGTERAALLGALFLIDYLYFENSGKESFT